MVYAAGKVHIKDFVKSDSLKSHCSLCKLLPDSAATAKNYDSLRLSLLREMQVLEMH